MVFRAFVSAVLAGIFAAAASASTTHDIRFVQPAKVLVWQADLLIGQGSEISVFDDAAANTRAHIGSGVLVPAALEDAFTQQPLRLSIASNTGFTIEADSAEMAARTSIRVIGRGANAQDLSRPVSPVSGQVFWQTEKTAKHPGSPDSQAIELEVTWTGMERPALQIRSTGSVR